MLDVLSWQAWFTLGVIVCAVVALVREMARPDIVLLGCVGLLLVGHVLTPEEAFAGFSNTAVLTVGALFVVAAGVQHTNALGMLNALIFQRDVGLRRALLQMMLPTGVLSAFLNNTPIVAMFAPRVQQWGEQIGISPSRLLIPLSYAAILGGMTTLIGTSTNLVVSGLMEAEGFAPLGLFDLTWVGLPAMLAVILFFVLGGYRLLPDRGDTFERRADGLDACMFEVRVGSRSSVLGQTVEEAGLRNLKDAYLAHVVRGGRTVPASPTDTLLADDRLVFIGQPRVLDELLQRPGLERGVGAVASIEDRTLPLFEAVVADGSTLVGKTLRDTNFRERFGGVVLGIQRRDAQIEGSLGRVPIRAGDLLLVEAQNGFDRRWNESREEFYLVANRRAMKKKPNARKAPLAFSILIGMVALAATGVLELATAAFAAALGMVATRCISLREARQAVDVPVLIVIAAALALGKAAQQTGLAEVVAHGVVTLAPALGPLGVLVLLYVTTNILTELITHKAAAVLMLPVALSVATELGADPKAFALIVAVGAAASFMTPIGYQTNLMVMAAGGYRYKDYFRIGLPVSLIVMAVAVTSISLVWL